uniref:(northern house mosquito) hypothetical protein n=1 Tax=Culex pipiens TaxID=7175 RepID=A0A8D8JIG2_CULPI
MHRLLTRGPNDRQWHRMDRSGRSVRSLQVRVRSGHSVANKVPHAVLESTSAEARPVLPNMLRLPAERPTGDGRGHPERGPVRQVHLRRAPQADVHEKVLPGAAVSGLEADPAAG